ncbi:MAG: NAD-dependent epimerase/dehydratase family protein [Candidatus Uhrbacteria bacterium]|nr:NAD-dependent epimerase/dehydratase family protein [Candidatus Uhrbacteria bacterium]
MSQSKQSHPHALVTGGAGFIGSHVVDALIGAGWRVTVIDDLSSGKRQNIHPAATFLKMDVRDQRASQWIIKQKPDAVLHFAAQISVTRSIKDPVADAETNIRASIWLMDAAAKAHVKRFIFAGTGGALCDETVPLPAKEHHVADPMSPYAIAKRAIELYGDFYRREYSLPFTSLRFANVYGPRQNALGEAGVIAIFVQAMLTNCPVAVNGTGKQTRDYVYVADVADAVMHALSNDMAMGVFHVGTGKETSVSDLFKRLAIITKYRKKAKKGPADTNAPARSSLDASLFTSITGWRPRTKLADGLKLTVLEAQAQQKMKNRICIYPFKKN